MLDIWFYLVLGLAIGWIIHALLDLFFWRNRRICTENEIALQKAVEQLEGQRVALNNQVSELNLQTSNLESSVQARDSRILTLTGDVDSRDAKITTLNGSLKARDATISGLETDLQNRRADLTGLRGQIGRLEADLTTRNTELGDLETQFEGRGVEISNLQAQIGERNLELGGLQAQLGERDVELANLRGQLGSIDSELQGLGIGALAAGGLMALRNRFNNMRANLEAKDTEIGNLNLNAAGQTVELEGLQANLAARDAELDGLNTQIVGLNADLSAREATLDSLNIQIDALNADIAAKELELGDLNTTLTARNTQLSDLEAQLAVAEKDAELAELYSAEADALRIDLDTRTNELTTLQAQLGDRDSSIEKMRFQLSEVDDQLSGMELEKTAGAGLGLGGLVGWLRNRKNTLEADVAERDNQLLALNSRLEADVSTRDIELENLRGQLNTRDIELGDLRAQLEARDADLASLQGQVGSIDDELKYLGIGGIAAGGLMGLRNRFNEMRASVEAKDAEIGALQLNAEGSSVELEGLSTTLAAKDIELGDLNAQIIALNADLEARDASIDGLNAQLGDLNTTLETKETELGDLNLQIGNLNIDLAARDARISEAEVELAAAAENAEIVELYSAEADALRVDLNTRADELAALQARLGERDAEIERLRLQLTEVDNELSGLNVDVDAETAAGAGLGLAGLIGWLRNRASSLESDVNDRDNQLLSLNAQVASTTADYDARIGDLQSAIAEREATILALQASAKPDNLTKVKGIGPKIAGALNDHGITTYAQLSQLTDDEIVAILEQSGVNYRLATPEIRSTWQAQAALLASGDLDQLKELQAGVKRSSGSGGLGKVWGIGAKVRDLLASVGVNNYTQLATSSTAEIDTALNAAKSYYPNMSNSEIHQSWVEQASFAANGQWSLLKGYKARFRRIYTPDDLTRIWGIGPKISEILADSGIDTFAELADATLEELDTILSEAGSQFNMTTDTMQVNWKRQARLAAIGDWEEFQKLHDSLDWEDVRDSE